MPSEGLRNRLTMVLRSGWVLDCATGNNSPTNFKSRDVAHDLYLPACGGGSTPCSSQPQSLPGPVCPGNAPDAGGLCVIAKQVPGGTAYLCGDNCNWSLDRHELATIVRWIGDSCEGSNGLTAGTATKAYGTSSPRAFQVKVDK